MSTQQIVSRDTWIAARKALLIKEKEATRAKDELSRLCRELPMVKIEKEYIFTGVDNVKHTLSDLFDGRRQLIIYHFMLGPEAKEPCEGCTFMVNNMPLTLAPLHNRGDTSFAIVSRAPAETIHQIQQEKGWTHIPWYSSLDSDFNYDFGVTIDVDHRVYNYKEGPEGEEAGERPGISVFLNNEEEDAGLFHTYSTYQRGVEPALWSYALLDMTKLGRQDRGSIPGQD